MLLLNLNYGKVLFIVKQFLKNKDNEVLKIKGAYYNGECYTGEDVLKIADLPSREELLSRLVLSMKSPISGFVFLLNNIMLNFINVLNAINDKKQNSLEEKNGSN